MNVSEYLDHNTKELQAAGISSARLDCLILLEDVLGKDRAHILAHPELALTSSQIAVLNNNITQRKQSIPLAYIRGKVAFYGREFAINTYVLVPRPETETMIDMLLSDRSALADRPSIADIGTGSGCIGITAALELPHADITLYDIDQQALQVAAKNAQQLKAQVRLRQQDLLQGVEQYFDVVLANLPYVPDNYEINAAARFEPHLALFAGQDGLDAYRRFWSEAGALGQPPMHIYTEALAFQHAANAQLAKEAGYSLVSRQDLIQHFSRQ